MILEAIINWLKEQGAEASLNDLSGAINGAIGRRYPFTVWVEHHLIGNEFNWICKIQTIEGQIPLPSPADPNYFNVLKEILDEAKGAI